MSVVTGTLTPMTRRTAADRHSDSRPAGETGHETGTDLLDVLVAADGRARDVRIERSSGFPLLDDAAVATVRRSWRFIPAKRDGVSVESRVTVPIRFRLADAKG